MHSARPSDLLRQVIPPRLTGARLFMSEEGNSPDKLEGARVPKGKRIVGRVIGFVSCLLILTPAVLALLYVREFGVNVVFFDAWSMVPIFDELSSGTFRVSSLFAQSNEHRMFFPKGVELLLAGFTEYDNLTEMYLILLCFLVTLVGLLLAFRSNVIGGGLTARLALFVPVALLVFSFRQHENMLFGYQINFTFTQTFGVLTLFALYVLGRDGSRRFAFVAALVTGTLASFSTAQGLLVWPVGLLQLLVGPLERRAKKVLIPIWALVGLGEWVLYFFDYTSPKNHPSLLYVLEHPAVGMEYFLNSLGGALFWQQSSALVAGVLVAALAVGGLFLVLKERALGEYSFWVSLLLYSFLVLASVTAGRAGFGAEQALVSRYASFSILAVVGVYAILAKAALERRSSARIIPLVVLSGLVLASAAVSYGEGVEVGAREKISREKSAFILSTYESQPDQVLKQYLYPNPRVVKRRAPVLEEIGYNVFSEPGASSLPKLSDLSPVSSPAGAEVGAIKGVIGAISQGGSLVVPRGVPYVIIAGWAVDPNEKDAAGGVYVDVDGKLFPAFYGARREGIAERFGEPAYEYSGFERAIPLSEIGAGTHELSIVVVTSDGKRYYRPDQKEILKTVRPGLSAKPSRARDDE